MTPYFMQIHLFLFGNIVSQKPHATEDRGRMNRRKMQNKAEILESLCCHEGLLPMKGEFDETKIFRRGLAKTWLIRLIVRNLNVIRLRFMCAPGGVNPSWVMV
jgi:hypothetical protein